MDVLFNKLEIDDILESAIKLEELGEYEHSIALYEIAIKYNCTTAMNRLADLISDPAFEFFNLDKSIELYNNSCQKGDPVGCYNLAIEYKKNGRLDKYFVYLKIAKSIDHSIDQ